MSQSDNIEINSSNAPNLSRNVEDNNDNEVEEISLSTLKDKKGNKVSITWDHFTKVTINREKKAKCMHCNAILEAKYTSGTTNLNRHVKSYFSKNQPKIQEALQGSLKVLKREDESCDIGFDSFDPNVLQSLITRMVVMDELPLKFVEYKGFREMMAHANPVVKPMSRNTLKNEILKLYYIENVKTLHMLEKNHGRVAITTDLWTTTNQKKEYMVVTTHFIDNSWKLHTQILRFIYVPSPHTAETLSNELVQCLLDWNVDRKLSSMTLDNCTTNDAMDGLKVIENGVGKIRESVSYWTQTPKRFESFELAARQLKINCKKSLKLDCPTRWNSTYAMLDVALMYKSVFSLLQQHESQYKSLPSDSEWDLAATMVEHLKSFYMLTEMFSGTKYPTANLFFPLICKMKMSINGWW
ncbi:hypothetical protein WN944_000940 [Citrus x changshan-huyou]|uniref:BED-type domain-containing protein n=1 Tax=Citrus x changshan-huyou TaxID=2935761 RepID=A0AAP0MDR1_9ROSI